MKKNYLVDKQGMGAEEVRERTRRKRGRDWTEWALVCAPLPTQILTISVQFVYPPLRLCALHPSRLTCHLLMTSRF